MQEMAAAVDREAGFRLQDYMVDPRSYLAATARGGRAGGNAEPGEPGADDVSPMDTDSESQDGDAADAGNFGAGDAAEVPQHHSGRAARGGAVTTAGYATAPATLAAAPNVPPRAFVPAVFPTQVAATTAAPGAFIPAPFPGRQTPGGAAPPQPPPPPPPAAAAAAAAGDAAGAAAAGEEEEEEEEEGEQMDMDEAVERLVEITNLPVQYARSVLIAHGGELAAAVAMVMDG